LTRRVILLLIMLFCLMPLPTAAQVTLAFHSFNGSYVVGRYPHAFIVLEGTLESNGRRVQENYGYSTSASAISALAGNVPGIIEIERDRYITSTNRHFTLQISDAQYHAIVAEMESWRDAAGQKRYSLDNRNCVHFVARIAEIAGINAPVPKNLVRRPKQWLKYVTALNPQVNALKIR
jgi:hypothetical protein